MAQMSVYESKDFNSFFEFDMSGYAEEVLNEGSKLLEDKMKSNARTSIKHSGDSEMINSIKASKPKLSKGAYIVNVGPRGYSKTKVYQGKKKSRIYPVSNALKAIWKEYGIPGRDISAQPFISPAVTQTQNQIYDLMQKKFEEKTGL